MRIAILNNDASQGAFVPSVLSAAGHVCHEFYEMAVFLRNLQRQSFDMVILDWDVPDMAGSQILQQLSHHPPRHLPTLFMARRDHPNDIASVLDAGADDYLLKPAPASVLVARVSALLRRAYQTSPPDVTERFGDIEFDMSMKQVFVKGRAVELTRKEFELALLLFQHICRPLSRTHMLDVIWKGTIDVRSRTMDTHVSNLRTKLGLRPENGYRLVPLYAYGYQLERFANCAVTAD
jgi:DNA-binding response OmpR family regulator